MHRKAPFSLLLLSLHFFVVLAIPSDAAVCNANHIFNAIHSSMRQWGGSLNHNGMTMFLATVPEGTQLYHGTATPDFVTGIQWLAFEPEHALIFAGPRRPPPGAGEGHRQTGGRESYEDSLAHDEGERKHKGSRLGLEHDGEYRNNPPLVPQPCTRMDCNPPLPPHDERRPRKHREHGPPPPLPPGHIYKPYPPPPHKGRPYKVPKRFSNLEYARLPPADHDDSAKHHKPPVDYNSPDHGHLSSSFRGNRDIPHPTATELQKRHSQQPLRNPTPLSQEDRTGYLHTYAPTHELHLLYIDGLSAGKTNNGTLDTQDLLLLNLTSSGPGGPMGDEMARASGLCELAATLWQDRIDGIIRLEGGFEIILCDFERHLRRVDVVAVERSQSQSRIMGGWAYLKAITARYHGIGGDRVRLDYNDFVSVFQHNIPSLWDNDVASDTPMPRLTNVAPTTLSSIKDEVTAMVLRKDRTVRTARNWQHVADMLVQRYSAPLHYITQNSGFRDDPAALTAYLHGVLRPFIDARVRNATRETERCVAQFVPAPSNTGVPLAHRAVHAVATRVCDVLLTSLSIAGSPLPQGHSGFAAVHAGRAVDVVGELIGWLGWTSWKECGECGDDEVCFIPIWPSGTLEDHAHPRCRGEKEVEGRTGYWGTRGPPRGKGEGSGGHDGRGMQWEGVGGAVAGQA